MGVHDGAYLGTRSVELAVNARLVRSFQAGSVAQHPSIEVCRDHFARLGEKQSGFFFAAAADQHADAVAAARTDMTGGLFELSELGENATGQRNVLGQRRIS